MGCEPYKNFFCEAARFFILHCSRPFLLLCLSDNVVEQLLPVPEKRIAALERVRYPTGPLLTYLWRTYSRCCRDTLKLVPRVTAKPTSRICGRCVDDCGRKRIAQEAGGEYVRLVCWEALVARGPSDLHLTSLCGLAVGGGDGARESRSSHHRPVSSGCMLLASVCGVSSAQRDEAGEVAL